MRGVMNPARRNALFGEDMSNGVECCVFGILSRFSGSIFRRPNGASGQIIHDKSCARAFRTCAFSNASQTRIAHLCSNLHLNLLY